MAKRNHYNERNPLKMVIYILAVLILLGCIGYLLLCSGKQKAAYQEEIERASAAESNLEKSEEEKTAKASEDETKDASAAKKNKEKKVSATPEATVTSEAPTAPVTPEPTATPAPTAVEQSAGSDKSIGVLVLNGTQRPGVAAYWKTKLETAGYSNVVPATYNKAVGQETVIYASSQELAQPFLALFPGAVVQVGTVIDGIELEAGVTMPEKCEVYIIVGNKDVNG